MSAAKPAFSRHTRRQSASPQRLASLERDQKTLIDLVDGLSSRSVVLVSVMKLVFAPKVSAKSSFAPCQLIAFVKNSAAPVSGFVAYQDRTELAEHGTLGITLKR